MNGKLHTYFLHEKCDTNSSTLKHIGTSWSVNSVHSSFTCKCRKCRPGLRSRREIDQVPEEKEDGGCEDEIPGDGQQRREVIDGAVRALTAPAHLANIEEIRWHRVEYRLVKTLRSVVVVHADWQIARHVGHREPPLDRKIHASVEIIQLKIKNSYLLDIKTNVAPD